MKSISKPTGLRYWMLRVLDECENVSADFSADPVHDLRVALRRCRSMADGMMAMDPNPSWKAMKKSGKQLFQRLGDLRDVQIMMEWIENLEQKIKERAQQQTAVALATEGISVAPSAEQPQPGASEWHHDATAQTLIHILKARESEHKNEARLALDKFDRKQWRQWSHSLPQRAARIRPGSPVFKHLALERWTEARQLHTRAMRSRSAVALHTLRIGIKRFRYIVENFLPAEHDAWSNDLKHTQDLLGEVHDLDVLWTTANSCHAFPDEGSRNLWHGRITEERSNRIDEYREKTTGPGSLWNVWREGLPSGKDVHEIATRRMKLWAKALDPDFAHSERVARLSLQLFDGLRTAGFLRGPADRNSEAGSADLRSSLTLAALLHDVGKSEGNKGHHKKSLELIKKHGTPLGWKEEDISRAALVARFHSGSLPSRRHEAIRDYLPDEQRNVIQLSAILRLANALDAAHSGQIRGIRIENPSANRQSARMKNGFRHQATTPSKNEAVIVAAAGYLEGTPIARAAAAERYLLETVLRRPVIVRRAK